MIGELLLAPRRGPGVCVDCCTPTRAGFARCLVCQRSERHIAAFAPIAYSAADGTLHRDIRSYKRDADPSVGQALNRLVELLNRFTQRHERCLAEAAGIAGFDVVTTIPARAGSTVVPHPMERIVSQRLELIRDRHERLLRRTGRASDRRRFDALRFESLRALDGQRVLLIDDMWTSGATAQSAAAALRRAGADAVGVIVIARHLGRRLSADADHLRRLAVPLDFGACVHCRDRGCEQDRVVHG